MQTFVLEELHPVQRRRLVAQLPMMSESDGTIAEPINHQINNVLSLTNWLDFSISYRATTGKDRCRTGKTREFQKLTTRRGLSMIH